MSIVADRIDQPCSQVHGTVGLQLFKLHRQLVMAALQQAGERIGMNVAAIRQPLIECFELMGQISYRANLGHPRATLERMQISQQCRQGKLVGGIGEPPLQRTAGGLEQVDRLVQENLDHLLVLLVLL